jgi:hypothetical protein
MAGIGGYDGDDVVVKGDDGTDDGQKIGADGDRLKADSTIADGVDPSIKAKVDLLKQIYASAQLRGATDGTPIGNTGDQLKVSGTLVFGDDFIKVAPGGGYESFVVLEHCTQKAILKQLRLINRHLSVLTDIEGMEDEDSNEPD